jgi:DNA adenine methylase
MHQPRLFELGNVQDIVNVASIPQRSPFRYPGGKTWLIPQVRRWLDSLNPKPQLLIEPFAGGAIVGLTAIFENLADRALLIELDERVGSVWQTILGGEGEWLANRILGFEMTLQNLEWELKKSGGSIREIAFQTILRNRTNHGGIMAPGAGFIKYGENGKGVASRWYPHTLARRIRDIDRIRERIDFVCGDGFAAIREYKEENNVAFFIDPPYTAAGKKAGARLYTQNMLDHEGLFGLIENVKGKFLMTYDDAAGVREMASRHGFQVEVTAMNNTHHTKMYELLISNDLAWYR